MPKIKNSTVLQLRDTKLQALVKLQEDMQVLATCFNTNLNQENVRFSEML